MAETDPSPPSRAQHPTRTGTLGSEVNLPRPPLPDLAVSAVKLLEWCAPRVDTAELARTESALATLRDSTGVGPTLQETLRNHDGNEEGSDHSTDTTSWLDRFWQFRYLGRRDRIAGNGNFFLLLTDPAGRSRAQPRVDRAAELVESAVAYNLALHDGTLPPDTAGGVPLSMARQRYLFGTTRIPGFAEDTVRTPQPDERGRTGARHIVVFHQGNIFRLEVIAPDGRHHSQTAIAAGLRTVVESSSAPAASDTAVGALTTRERAQWAASRQGLLAHDEVNASALETVETALLCLCLDDTTPDTAERACAELMHGTAGNRWFDKSLSLIVFADGNAGINADMSCLDVATVTSFVDALYDTAAEWRTTLQPSNRDTTAAQPVEFRLDEALRANVRVAAAEFEQHRCQVTSRTLTVGDCGSDTIEPLAVSTDAFLQLAYQLAHQRAHGYVPAVYEPVGMRHFRNGRTAALRPVTTESVRFVTAMTDPGTSTAARREALRAAAAKHDSRVAECHAGQAPEQHLWELQRIARQQGRAMGIYEVPELYESPGWSAMRADQLSVRSTTSPNVRYLGTGPADGPGIGAAHVLGSRAVTLHLSAPTATTTELDTYRDEFRRAVTELHELLSQD